MNIIAKSVCLIVATGALWTGIMISGAKTIIERDAITSATADIYIQQPLSQLVSMKI